MENEKGIFGLNFEMPKVSEPPQLRPIEDLMKEVVTKGNRIYWKAPLVVWNDLIALKEIEDSIKLIDLELMKSGCQYQQTFSENLPGLKAQKLALWLKNDPDPGPMSDQEWRDMIFENKPGRGW